MTPCITLTEPYALPFEIGFLPAWESIKAQCDQILMSSKCSRCDKRGICSVCPASNQAETGSFQQASVYHCEMTTHMLEMMYQMLEEAGIDVRQLFKKG